MSVDAMTIGVQMRKVIVFSIGTCYRSICNHLFRVGFLFFLIFLYGSSPFVFSFMVSASPVLVCTALLLGTLLSFGQLNIPEIEKEEQLPTCEIASLKIEIVEDATTVKGDGSESFETVPRYAEKGRDMLENDIDESSTVESTGTEVQVYASAVDPMLLNDVIFGDIQCEKQFIDKVERDSGDLLEMEKNGESPAEKPRIEGRLIDGEVLDNLCPNNAIKNVVRNDQFPKESIDDVLQKGQLSSVLHSSLFDAPNENLLGSAPGSCSVDALREGHLGFTPGSSFIDALMENHFASPGSSLIDAFKEDQLVSASNLSWRRMDEDYSEVDGSESLDSGSDGAESSSPDASMFDIMPMLDELHPLLELQTSQPAETSHDGSDSHSERLCKGDDESMDSDEVTDNQDESSNSEEDTSTHGEEGEGNDENDDSEEEEGESAKKEKEDKSKFGIKWTEVDQKNLMDLGTSEFERNQRLENLIARRRARKIMRLTAERNLIDLESCDFPSNIPLIVTRQNPFGLPDDTYDNMAIPGSAPSILLPRHNPFDIPYDLSEEKPDLKGDSFQQEFSLLHPKEPVYQRNETFSIGPSVFRGSRHKRQDLMWKHFMPKQFSFEEFSGYPSFQRQLSEVSESKLSSVPDSELVNAAVDDYEEDRKSHYQVVEQFSSDGTSCATLQQKLSTVSESKASFVHDTRPVSSIAIAKDKRLHERDNSQETEVISNTDNSCSHIECGSKPSTEADENVPDTIKEVLSTTLEQKESVAEESGVSTETLPESSEFLFMSEMAEHTEPVHDSSPPGMDKFLSFTSISTEAQLEISEMTSLPVLFECAEKEFEVQSEDIEVGSSSFEETYTLPSQVNVVDEKSSSELVKLMSRSDKSPSYDDRDQPQGAVTNVMESIKKLNVVNNDNRSTDSNQKERSLSSLTPGSTSTIFKSLESRSPVGEEVNTVPVRNACRINDDEHGTEGNPSSINLDSSSTTPFQNPKDQAPGGEDVKKHVLDRSYSKDKGHVEEHFSHSLKAYDPCVYKENINEEPDEIKEIDEKLLSELETIGDFSVKEVVGKSHRIELTLTETNISGLESLGHDLISLQTVLDLPTLEPSSVQDTVSEFKQLDDRAYMYDVILPSMLEDQVVNGENNTEMLVAEAQCVEYLHEVLEQVPQNDLAGLSKPLGSNVYLAEVEETEMVSTEQLGSSSDVLSIIQDDCATAIDELKQVSEEASDNSVLIIPDGKKEKIVTEDQAPEMSDIFAIDLLPSDSTPAQTNLELPTVEAKSIEDVLALKHLDGVDVGEVILPSMLENQVVDGESFSDIPVVEAQTVEEIHALLKQVSQCGVAEELPKPLESNDHSSKVLSMEQIESYNDVHSDIKDDNVSARDDFKYISEETSGLNVAEDRKQSIENDDQVPTMMNVSGTDSTSAQTNLELPILEAKSNEDVVSALKLLNEGADVEDVILSTMLENQIVDGESNTDTPNVEARSTENIHVVLKQVSKSGLDELPKPSEPNDHSAAADLREEDSSERSESSSDVLSGIEEDSATAADEPQHVYEETYGSNSSSPSSSSSSGSG